MTTPATLPASVSELFGALEQIPGVSAVGLDSGPDSWLRVDLYESADEAAVRAALADVLRARTSGEPAEIRRQETVGSSGADGSRLALDRLVLTSGASVGSAEVSVALDDRLAPGSAPVSLAEDAEAGEADTAVATALLLALEELTEDAVIGSVEEITFPDGGGTASVRLRLDVDGSEVPAEASVPVLGHRPQALARAVLAAVEPHLPS